MSEALLPTAGNDIDDELEFDDPVPELPSSVPEPIKSVGSRKKKAAVSPAPAPPSPEPDLPPAAPAVTPPSSDTIETATPADAAPQPAPAAKPHPLLIATVALALLTSLLSLGGMIAVGRTLAAAQADRHTARESREKLDQVPALVARLSAESARLEAISARITAATPGGPPATLVDIRHELDTLKLQLAQSQPQGMDALGGTMRQSFSELSTKIDRIGDRVGAHVSASRPDPREDDQGPPS